MQILILLSLMLSLLASDQPATSGWPITLAPAGSALLTLLTTAAIVLLCAGYNLLTCNALDRGRPLDRRRYRRNLARLAWLALVVFAVQLFVFDWPRPALAAAPLPVIGELAIWSPFCLMILGFWSASYPVDARLRLLDIQHRLAVGAPVYPPAGPAASWTIWQFLAFQVRFHMLLILVPLVAIISLRLLVDRLITLARPHLAGLGLDGPRTDALLAGLLLVSTLFVLVLAPPVLSRIFSSQPLPDSRLREKLLLAISRLGVRVRQVLLWNTHGMVSNAAVMGFWGRLRYVLLSDALIETLPDEQIEGVFGHELGHVVHHHLLYYLLLIISLLVWGAVLGSVVMDAEPIRQLLANRHHLRLLAEVGLLVVVGGAMLVMFGWVSRRFEWQADLTGAQSIILGPLADSPIGPVAQPPPAVDVAQPPSAVIPPPPPALKSPPHPTAAEIYIAGLYRIADMNGLDRGQRTWRHGSILARGQHLRRLCEPEYFARFQFTLRLVRLGIVALAAAAAAAFAWTL